MIQEIDRLTVQNVEHGEVQISPIAGFMREKWLKVDCGEQMCCLRYILDEFLVEWNLTCWQLMNMQPMPFFKQWLKGCDCWYKTIHHSILISQDFSGPVTLAIQNIMGECNIDVPNLFAREPD